MGKKNIRKEFAEKYMEKCPCGADKDFFVVSEQCAEDFCEIFVQCKACNKRTEDAVEDVWGLLDKFICLNAVSIWNEEIKKNKNNKDADGSAEGK